MIKFLKNLFASTKVAKREYDLIEKMHLRRLEQEEEYCEHKGKRYYSYIGGELKLIKILGAYRYLDVDGVIAGLVAEDSEGRISNIGFRAYLFKRKPHDWLIHLDESNIRDYIRMQKYVDDKQLDDKFYKELPKDIIRDIKIKKLINK